jgi:dGTP triphosphohydrolase
MKESEIMEKIKPMLFTSLKGYNKSQFVKDLISGMTDRYALNMYDKLFVPQEWRQL